MDDDPIRLAAWRAISETGSHRAVAAAFQARFGWRGTERQAVSRLAQMLNPQDPHQLPADGLLDIVAITGRDEFTGLLLRARIEAEIRDEHANAERAGMARVAPSRTQHDRRRA